MSQITSDIEYEAPQQPDGVPDPSDLRQRVDRDLKLRREITQASAKRIRMYAGANYRASFGMDVYENHPFQWCATAVPLLVYNNPSCKVTDAGCEDAVTREIQNALRSWIPQVKLSRELTLIAFDCQFDFGVAVIDHEPTPGLKSPFIDPLTGEKYIPMRPRLRRLSPRLYFEDCESAKYGAPRQQGHIVIKTKEDMGKELNPDGTPRFNMALVEELASEEGLKQVEEDLMLGDGVALDREKSPVVYFQVYMPATNMLLTLGFTGDGRAQYLCPPRVFRGVRGGPYHRFSKMLVPDQVYPLADLAVHEQQTDEINRHKKQAADDAGTAKRLTVINAASQGVIANIQDARSGDVLSVPGFNGIVSTVDMGGPMPAQLEYITYAQGELYRISALSNTQRGEVKSGQTATADAIANQYSDLRNNYAKSRFAEDVSDCLGKIAEFMTECDYVQFPVVKDKTVVNPFTGMPVKLKVRGTFMGGAHVNPPGVNEDESPWQRCMSVVIEPYSMEYVNQTVLRSQMIEVQTQVLQIAQAIAGGLIPHEAGVNMVNDLCETLNMKESGEDYLGQPMPMLAAPPGDLGVTASPDASEPGRIPPQGRTAPMLPSGVPAGVQNRQPAQATGGT